MSSEERHLNRYVQLYSSLGWNSLFAILNISTYNFKFFREKGKVLAFDLLSELVEVGPCAVVFASFSGGPKSCMYKVLQIIKDICEAKVNPDDHQSVRDCLSGYIYDSSPVDFTSDLGARFIVHPTVLNVVLSAKISTVDSKWDCFWA